jgi:hypothetical protein
MWQHSKIWEPSNITQARLLWGRVKYVITFVLRLLNYIKLVGAWCSVVVKALRY